MGHAAENLQFELAALYRDRLQAAQRIAEQQKIISTTQEDADYIAVAQDARTGETAVQVFMVRHGRLIGRDNFLLEGADPVQEPVTNGRATTRSMLASRLGTLTGIFIQQFYDNATFIPT